MSLLSAIIKVFATEGTKRCKKCLHQLAAQDFTRQLLFLLTFAHVYLHFHVSYPYDEDFFYNSKQFQSFFKHSSRSLVLKADAPKFTILAVSDAYLVLTHKQRDELLGRGLFEVYPGSQSDLSEQNSVHSSFMRAISTKVTDELPVFRYEIYVADTDSYTTEYWTNVNEPLLDEQGNVAYLINTTTNITEQIRSRQAIAESEERFRNMAESSGILIAVTDEAGLVTYLNQAWTTLTGRTTDELLEHAWKDLVHPNDSTEYLKLYFHALEKQLPFNGEFRVLDANGEYRWLLSYGSPRFKSDGSFAGHIASVMDITERKQDEQRKNTFISMVSHELKTPLTSAISYVQVARKKILAQGDQVTAGMMERAGKQLDKMTRIINGFLNISRLESGKIHIDWQHFDLALLFREIEEETMLSISSHHIIFAPVEPCWIYADREKIGHVLENLISNAVKYSPLRSIIRVACIKVGGMAEIRVTDQGIGITKEDLPQLFEPYYRVEQGPVKHTSGFGIGLYLCREIIERHEGRIWVESEINKGSTFYFTLNLASDANT
jgi:PAS domain S-box-containing protein